jgi:hypothetical protein
MRRLVVSSMLFLLLGTIATVPTTMPGSGRSQSSSPIPSSTTPSVPTATISPVPISPVVGSRPPSRRTRYRRMSWKSN